MITGAMVATWIVGSIIATIAGIFTKKAYTKITKTQAQVDMLHQRLNEQQKPNSL